MYYEDKKEEEGAGNKGKVYEDIETEGSLGKQGGTKTQEKETYKKPFLDPHSHPYIEFRSEASQSTIGLVTRSRSKVKWEETLESKEEQVEPQAKKGRKPNMTIRELE